LWLQQRDRATQGIAVKQSLVYTEQMTKPEQLPTSTDAVSNHLLVKIAELYFLDDLTQLQISRRLGISRQKVQRLIRAAKEKGIVQITIQPVRKTSSHLERQIEKQFSLKEALVVETDEYDEHDKVAQALGSPSAEYLLRVVVDGDSIAVSWGSTLRAVVDALPTLGKPLQNVRVIQALGGLGNPNTDVHASDLAKRMARIFSAEAILLPAPGVVKTSAAHRALLEDYHVERALTAARNATIAVMTLGVPRQDSLLMREGQIVSWPELMQLRDQGAVGDVNLRYFDGQGRAIPSDLDKRTISLTIDEIRRIDRVVIIAGGRRKFKAIAAALQGRLPDVLITDSTTARRLLKTPSAEQTELNPP
jgi:DNA-binding transcriptional regulator LsrR (DeoR family)